MLRLQCNSGTVPITLVRDLEGYGTVWYHHKCITNILYPTRVKHIYHITYDSTKVKYFTFHKGEGGTKIFV